MRFIAIFLVVSLAFSVCPPRSIAQDVLPSTTPAAQLIEISVSDDYVLGSADVLEAHLIVKDNALVLDYSLAINPEGKVYFPNIGEIALSGLSIKQAKQKLAQTIKKKYQENFELSLMLTKAKLINIYLTGQVDKPGLLPVPDGTRLVDVLKISGVAKGGSDLSESVLVTRKDSQDKIVERRIKLSDIFLEGNDDANVSLRHGDIVSVPAVKSYVYVYGDVARSGTFGYVKGQTLSDYINLSGGPTGRANLSGVTVTRHENGQAKVFKVNVDDILHKGKTDKDMVVLAGDVIFVPGNFFYFTDFATFANTVLLAVTLYTALIR